MYDTRADPILEISGSKPNSTGWHPTSFTHEPFAYNGSYGSPGQQSHPQLSPGMSQNEYLYGAVPGVGAAGMYAAGATNARDSAYFRTHRPGESEDIGPSVSQVGSAVTGSGSGSGSGRGRGRGGSSSSHGGSSASQVLLAKQALVNDELRGEVDNLRRDLERIREERAAAGSGGGSTAPFGDDLPPPQYSDA